MGKGVGDQPGSPGVQTPDASEKRRAPCWDDPTGSVGGDIQGMLEHLHAMRAGACVGKNYEDPRLDRHWSNVVSWICRVCTRTRLCARTACLAVTLYDDVLRNEPSIPEITVQLVAIGCILVAAKCEECVDDVPRVDALARLASNVFTHDHITAMEAAVLNMVDWRVNRATAAHFLDIFLIISRDTPDASRFLAAAMGDPRTFRDMPAQELGAAAVCAARRTRGVSPPWTEALERASSVSAPHALKIASRVHALALASARWDGIAFRSI